MKTETIEWFTPEEKLPVDKSEVLMMLDRTENSFFTIVHAVYYRGRFQSVGGNRYNPTHWAYMPKGPQ